MDIRALQNLAYSPPDSGVPDRVKEKIDRGVASLFQSAWRGILQVASSGFGKGLLIAAAVILGGAALAGGFLAYSGTIELANHIPMTVDTGVKLGLGAGWDFLTSGLGIAALAVGGATGAVADVRTRQNQLTKEMAVAEARQFEIARALQRTPAIEPAVAPSQETAASTQSANAGPQVRKVESAHKQPTNGKAAASLASATIPTGKPWEEEECGPFCKAEKLRRAQQAINAKAF